MKEETTEWMYIVDAYESGLTYDSSKANKGYVLAVPPGTSRDELAFVAERRRVERVVDPRVMEKLTVMSMVRPAPDPHSVHYIPIPAVGEWQWQWIRSDGDMRYMLVVEVHPDVTEESAT